MLLSELFGGQVLLSELFGNIEGISKSVNKLDITGCLSRRRQK
ncbi:hypothetical protein DET56_11267 [Paenibacillus pabuli]|uniref:Uncharacterized protein n=1 Tax=Paenibacillus pabuli TaxID=1472 RepID=A0A855Y173_9BACL|nr:hypothetical protein DET56_11267 [Paenibacillus pabuli]PXW02850.1 hypothetical protein DEU73_111158 [Paenibacillus taichungensis]